MSKSTLECAALHCNFYWNKRTSLTGQKRPRKLKISPYDLVHSISLKRSCCCCAASFYNVTSSIEKKKGGATKSEKVSLSNSYGMQGTIMDGTIACSEAQDFIVLTGHTNVQFTCRFIFFLIVDCSDRKNHYLRNWGDHNLVRFITMAMLERACWAIPCQ